MPAKVTIKETRDVALRFVESYNELRYRKIVKTKKDFCAELGISVSNLKRLSDAGSTSEPTVTNILLLNQKFNVSLEWLMLGKGEFMKDKNK